MKPWFIVKIFNKEMILRTRLIPMTRYSNWGKHKLSAIALATSLKTSVGLDTQVNPKGKSHHFRILKIVEAFCKPLLTLLRAQTLKKGDREPIYTFVWMSILRKELLCALTSYHSWSYYILFQQYRVILSLLIRHVGMTLIRQAKLSPTAWQNTK